MNPRTTVAALRVAIVCLPLAAASGQAAAQVKDPVYGLTLQSRQAEYRIGAPVPVEIITKNLAKHEIEATDTGGMSSGADLYYMIDVRDGQGNSAVETPLGKAIRSGTAFRIGSTVRGLGEPSPKLQPGKSKTDEVLLNRLYDLTQPGRYTVQVRRRDDTSGTAPKSNMITITIIK